VESVLPPGKLEKSLEPKLIHDALANYLTLKDDAVDLDLGLDAIFEQNSFADPTTLPTS